MDILGWKLRQKSYKNLLHHSSDQRYMTYFINPQYPGYTLSKMDGKGEQTIEKQITSWLYKQASKVVCRLNTTHTYYFSPIY
jgi:hypothetical protein